MVFKQRRLSTRSRAWPDTLAIVTAADPLQPDGRGKVEIRGNVRNIGSSGMFLETEEHLPRNMDVEIEILFDPNSNVSNLSVKAEGITVRRTKEGMGIRFNAIDLSRLQKCIVEKMNRLERSANAMYTLGGAESKKGKK